MRTLVLTRVVVSVIAGAITAIARHVTCRRYGHDPEIVTGGFMIAYHRCRRCGKIGDSVCPGAPRCTFDDGVACERSLDKQVMRR